MKNHLKIDWIGKQTFSLSTDVCVSHQTHIKRARAYLESAHKHNGHTKESPRDRSGMLQNAWQKIEGSNTDALLYSSTSKAPLNTTG
jgi:hypothetical protein